MDGIVSFVVYEHNGSLQVVGSQKLYPYKSAVTVQKHTYTNTTCVRVQKYLLKI